MTAQSVIELEEDTESSTQTSNLESVLEKKYSTQFFKDTEIYHLTHTKQKSQLDKAYWESLYRDVDFEDDTSQKKEKKKAEKKSRSKTTTRTSPKFSGGNMTAVWYLMSIVLMAVVVWYILRYLNFNNIKNTEADLAYLIDDSLPDEDALRKSDLKTPFEEAYKNGNYKLAFRIRYLDILKLLMKRNHILYKKEKTNLEYLLQVSSQPYYPIFNKLTLSFDTIWYGDLLPNKSDFDLLFLDFNQLEKEVLNA
ncbi:MAG: hypothetical protein IT245_01450 [Bacteroidia bacterium]|nr:hypothetical protein [Bacteroidia bacterium]